MSWFPFSGLLVVYLVLVLWYYWVHYESTMRVRNGSSESERCRRYGKHVSWYIGALHSILLNIFPFVIWGPILVIFKQLLHSQQESFIFHTFLTECESWLKINRIGTLVFKLKSFLVHPNLTISLTYRSFSNLLRSFRFAYLRNYVNSPVLSWVFRDTTCQNRQNAKKYILRARISKYARGSPTKPYY